MHPLLEQLSVFTWMDIIGSKERSIGFLQVMELIPKMRDDCAPECPKCSGPMTSSFRSGYILGWRWVCQKFNKKENSCPGSANPLDGTFFEGLKLSFVDVFALMFGYILKLNYDGMKDHLDCWRSRRKGKVISNVTIINFYSRFDEVILHALNQKGETFKEQGKIDRKKLLKKYTKTLNAEPLFRNIVFQLLMDIKSKYPCAKRRVIQTNADLSSSIGASLSAKDTSSNGSVFNASISTESNTSNSAVLNASNSTILSASNSTALKASNSNNLTASNSAVLNDCNSIVSNLSASTVSNLSTTTISSLSTSPISPVLNSSDVSVENTRVGNDINSKSVCVPNNTQSSNIGVSENSNLPSCSSTSVVKKMPFIENTNSTKVKNVVTLNNSPSSTNLSFAAKSFSDNSISNSPIPNIIIDSIFHDHENIDVSMDIDHDEIITTTYND